MRKILFISGIQIFPPQSGGQLRSANICLSLAALGFAVEIYSYTGRKIDYKILKKSSKNEIQNNLSEFTNRNLINGLIQFIFYKFNLPPLWLTWITTFFIPKDLINKINISDSIILDFPYFYPITDFTKKKIILNTHNAEFKLYSKNLLISKYVKRIETKSFKKIKEILFCNSDDRKQFITKIPELANKGHILPNGIILSQFSFSKSDRIKIRNYYNITPGQNVFIFTGSKYHPNQDAFNFLESWSNTHFQKLKELDVVILIVGSVCTKKIEKSYFKSIGKVDDIKPFFWASDYGINPINIGSGTNVKMTEYLATKIPILTTSFGARGLNLIDEKSCLMFERENLLAIIEKALHLDLSQKREMARRALEENIKSVDMSEALKSLNIKW